MRSVALLAVIPLLGLGCGSGGPSMSSSTTSSVAAGAASMREAKTGPYLVTPLVSDGSIPAPVTEARLVNAWGLVSGPTTPWWVANNGTGTASLFDGNGQIVQRLPFIDVAGAGGAPAAPTGVVFSSSGFAVTGPAGSGPARFIFASEDGTLSAWTPAADPATSIVAVDNSGEGAVYKGLALVASAAGQRLLATDFHNGHVDVFDSDFHPVGGMLFVDPKVESGFAPFGIRALDGVVYVTYAKQDADAHDDVAGQGNGFVSAFTVDGAFIRRVASHGHLNSPWGLARAPASGFGKASGKLLVGQFGSGQIVVLEGGNDQDGGFGGGGELLRNGGSPITIDGLWSLAFGNGNASGPQTTLFFTAGPNHESEGLFGTVTAVPGSHD